MSFSQNCDPIRAKPSDSWVESAEEQSMFDRSVSVGTSWSWSSASPEVSLDFELMCLMGHSFPPK